MIRFAILITIVASIFSFLAFQQGGVLPGIILAIVAIVPIATFSTAAVRARHTGRQAPWSSAAKSVIAVASVLLLAGVSYSAYWLFAAPKAEKNLTYTSAFNKACTTPPKYFPSAAKHEGPGPHPIAVFYDRGGSSSLDQLQFDYRSSDAWTARTATQVQLVACLSDFDRGAQVGQCTFTKGTAPLYTGTYKGSVFAAHTHTKVGDVQVPGSPAANESRDCPSLIYIKGEVKDQQFHTQPDPTVVQRILGQYVKG